VNVPAIILEDEEDGLLIYFMSEGATDIFKKRKDEGCYSIGYADCLLAGS